MQRHRQIIHGPCANCDKESRGVYSTSQWPTKGLMTCSDACARRLSTKMKLEEDLTFDQEQIRRLRVRVHVLKRRLATNREDDVAIENMNDKTKDAYQAVHNLRELFQKTKKQHEDELAEVEAENKSLHKQLQAADNRKRGAT